MADENMDDDNEQQYAESAQQQQPHHFQEHKDQSHCAPSATASTLPAPSVSSTSAVVCGVSALSADAPASVSDLEPGTLSAEQLMARTEAIVGVDLELQQEIFSNMIMSEQKYAIYNAEVRNIRHAKTILHPNGDMKLTSVMSVCV